MTPTPILGRSRALDAARKQQLCQLVRQSYSLQEAAAGVDVSLRTLQRERLRDETFDEQIRGSLQAKPDPLRLMEESARAHWRAAAWLLERSRPDEYGRKAANAARPRQVEAALDLVLEAALEAVAPSERAAVYQPVQAACDRAFAQCFPAPPLATKSQPATPLADEQWEQLAASESRDDSVDRAALDQAPASGERAPVESVAMPEVAAPPIEVAEATEVERSETELAGDEKAPTPGPANSAAMPQEIAAMLEMIAAMAEGPDEAPSSSPPPAPDEARDAIARRQARRRKRAEAKRAKAARKQAQAARRRAA
jgi:hypothetical protein